MMGLSGGSPVPEWLEEALGLVRRLSVAYLFWCASLWLTAFPVGARVARVEPYIFFVFCSHELVLKMFVPVGSTLFGGYYAPTYPIYFFLQPVLALGVGVAGCWLMARAAPALLRPFNAGKVPSVDAGGRSFALPGSLRGPARRHRA
jgi:hypothetical protein